MLIAALPVDEEMRIADLASYDILGTEAEKDYDELVELAAEICECPISLVSLIDKNRQWFKSAKGIAVKETPRHLSFCSHAILQDDLMIVPDAKKDDRFADNPLVTDDPNVQFYAGAPIVSPAGYKLGTVCVIDTRPRELTRLQQKALITISRQITRLLELRIKNKTIIRNADELLRLKNKVIQRNLYQQEQTTQYIATTLHESLAQELAVCSFYAELAKTSDNKEGLLKKIQVQLEKSIQDIRSMCNEITPYSLKILPLISVLEEHIESAANSFPFKVHFRKEEITTALTEKENIALFRAVENWLSWLAKDKTIRNVWVTISCRHSLEIAIRDDGNFKTETVFKKELVLNNVEGYVEQINGKIITDIKTAEGNNLLIKLPLSVAS